MAKAVGYEIVEFYQQGWPDKHYVDDCDLDVTEDGKIVPSFDSPLYRERDNPEQPLDEKYELNRFGVIIHEDSGEHQDFAYFFNKWKKAKETATIVVTVPKSRFDEIVERMKAEGYKIA